MQARLTLVVISSTEKTTETRRSAIGRSREESPEHYITHKKAMEKIREAVFPFISTDLWERLTARADRALPQGTWNLSIELDVESEHC